MEWINVKEKLPNKENKKIICLINGYAFLCTVHDATLCLISQSVSFYWPTKEWIKEEYFGDVTHWMPLPEPPKDQ